MDEELAEMLDGDFDARLVDALLRKGARDGGLSLSVEQVIWLLRQYDEPGWLLVWPGHNYTIMSPYGPVRVTATDYE